MFRGVFIRAISNKDLQEPELDLLPLLVKRKGTAIDVGASPGIYSDRLSRLADWTYAYEAHPRLARVVRSSLPSDVAVR